MLEHAFLNIIQGLDGKKLIALHVRDIAAHDSFEIIVLAAFDNHFMEFPVQKGELPGVWGVSGLATGKKLTKACLQGVDFLPRNMKDGGFNRLQLQKTADFIEILYVLG